MNWTQTTEIKVPISQCPFIGPWLSSIQEKWEQIHKCWLYKKKVAQSHKNITKRESGAFYWSHLDFWAGLPTCDWRRHRHVTSQSSRDFLLWRGDADPPRRPRRRLHAPPMLTPPLPCSANDLQRRIKLLSGEGWLIWPWKKKSPEKKGGLN